MSCFLSMFPCEGCGEIIKNEYRTTIRLCPSCKRKRDYESKQYYKYQRRMCKDRS